MIPYGELPDDLVSENEDLSEEDQALWESLALQVSQADESHLCFSEETVEVLERLCPPVELGPDQIAGLADIFERATSDLEFETAVKTGTRRATLGDYLFFLRQRAGHSVADTAQEIDLD
ncbi:MAG: hypothetical protein JWN14_405, partial [Chthonomonadales bacterium]|nr:hypothetical protein [Chthonomonadales bacterium]